MNDTQIWPTETPMQIMDVTETHNERAERLNGRLAMLGVIAAIGSYVVTGQLIPGVWKCHKVKEHTEQRKVVHLKRNSHG